MSQTNYATHPVAAYPKYLKNTTDNHDKSINRFIEGWELERLLFPLKPTDHMYVCTLLDDRMTVLKSRSSVIFKVHSDSRWHLPPHEMSWLYCKAQNGHKDINYRPEVFQSVLLNKFEEIKWLNCQHGSQLPTQTVVGYNIIISHWQQNIHVQIFRRWSACTAETLSRTEWSAPPRSSAPTLLPTERLGNVPQDTGASVTLQKERQSLNFCSAQQRGPVIHSGLLWIPGEEISDFVYCRKTLKRFPPVSPRQVSSTIKCWCDLFWRDECCFRGGFETKSSWFNLKNKTFGFIGVTWLYMIKMKWRE